MLLIWASMDNGWWIMTARLFIAIACINVSIAFLTSRFRFVYLFIKDIKNAMGAKILNLRKIVMHI